jgi:hypothetical protein
VVGIEICIQAQRQMKDYYSILGLKDNAEAADIKRAYRALAVKYHPDRNPSPEAVAIFSQMNEAYSTLSDPGKKFVYDHQRYKYLHPVQEEPVQQHRDPKYHPPVATGKDSKKRFKHFFQKINRFVGWVNIIGAAFVILLTLDYFTPYVTTEETITQIETVSMMGSKYSRGRSFSHFRTHTASGKEIKDYKGFGVVGDTINLSCTPICRIPMSVENISADYSVTLGFIYKHLMMFPVALFLTAVFGIFLRKQAERAFSCGIGTVILLIITLSRLN